MSDTFTQIHIHAVAAVKYRAKLIRPVWKENCHKMLSINTMPDHLHLFFGFRPTQSLSVLMRLVKGESSEWINKQRLTPGHFHWQGGYGAFSYARSQVHDLIHYIKHQEEHHRKKTFREEYRELLQEFDISFEEQYLFREPE